MDEVNLNLYDFTARQYDPQIGRFWGLDPASQFPGGYTGMGNDPANNVDPSGCFINTHGLAFGTYVSPKNPYAGESILLDAQEAEWRRWTAEAHLSEEIEFFEKMSEQKDQCGAGQGITVSGDIKPYSSPMGSFTIGDKTFTIFGHDDQDYINYIRDNAPGIVYASGNDGDGDGDGGKGDKKEKTTKESNLTKGDALFFIGIGVSASGISLKSLAKSTSNQSYKMLLGKSAEIAGKSGHIVEGISIYIWIITNIKKVKLVDLVLIIGIQEQEFQ